MAGRFGSLITSVTLAIGSLFFLHSPVRGADDWSGCMVVPIYWAPRPSPNPRPAWSPSPMARPRLAQPTPAPPSRPPFALLAEGSPPKQAPAKSAVAESTNAEAAIKLHGAAVREDGPFYDSYPIVLKPEQKPADDQCVVSFKNLSGRPVKITVDMQEQTLPPDGSAKMQVKRQFVWRMEGREAQREQIKAGDFALQIVIRR